MAQVFPFLTPPITLLFEGAFTTRQEKAGKRRKKIGQGG